MGLRISGDAFGAFSGPTSRCTPRPTPGRIVSLPDLHGDLFYTVATLLEVRLIDAAGHWAGGRPGRPPRGRGGWPADLWAPNGDGDEAEVGPDAVGSGLLFYGDFGKRSCHGSCTGPAWVKLV